MPAKLGVHRIVSHPDLDAGGTPALESEANVYLLVYGRSALLIDSGFSSRTSYQDTIRLIDSLAVRVEGIALTHGHPDHVSGAPTLALALQCPIYCHPDEQALIIRTWQSQALPPEEIAAARQRIVPELRESHRPFPMPLTVLHTPGHTHGHVALLHEPEGQLFCGDTILPSGTVWIGPPDGHMKSYLTSLRKLLDLPVRIAYCGHEAPSAEPRLLTQRILARRLDRENDILNALFGTWVNVRELTFRVYKLSAGHPVYQVAVRTVLAHLQHLEEEGRVESLFDRIQMTLVYRASRQGQTGDGPSVPNPSHHPKAVDAADQFDADH